jgi:hypothetical protein
MYSTSLKPIGSAFVPQPPWIILQCSKPTFYFYSLLEEVSPFIGW